MNELQVVPSHRHMLWFPTERKTASPCSRRTGKTAPERSCFSHWATCLIWQCGTTRKSGEYSTDKHRPPEESVSWACPASQLLILQSGKYCTVPSPFWAIRMCAFPPCLMLWAPVSLYVIMYPHRLWFLTFLFSSQMEWTEIRWFILSVYHTPLNNSWHFWYTSSSNGP